MSLSNHQFSGASTGKARDVSLLHIPYRTVVFDEQAPNKKRVEYGANQIIDLAGRKIVVVDMNGFPAPFYLSSGNGGKKNCPAGKWYPFLGYHEKRQWLNKPRTPDLVSYFGAPHLRMVAEALDRLIGDIRTDNSVPKVAQSGPHFDFINQGLTPVENNCSFTVTGVYQNLENILERISYYS